MQSKLKNTCFLSTKQNMSTSNQREEEEWKDEREPLYQKADTTIAEMVDVSKLDAEIMSDPLVAQLPKAMLKYIKTPKENQLYDLYIYIIV